MTAEVIIFPGATVRTPPRPTCTRCNGAGVVWLDRDPNPRAAWGSFECEHCKGDGFEPEGPCGRDCYCWFPLEKSPDGSTEYGLCVKDEDPERLKANEDYSAWRENLK